MLDRKTKNIDAGIELLKDRKDDAKEWEILSLIVGTFFLLAGFAFLTLIHTSYGISICFSGLAMLVIGGYFMTQVAAFNLLIQSKKIMGMQDDNTILLDAILNEMDSLERKVNRNKVKK